MTEEVRFIVKVVGLVAFTLATLGVSYQRVSFAVLGFTCWYALTQW